MVESDRLESGYSGKPESWVRIPPSPPKKEYLDIIPLKRSKIGQQNNYEKQFSIRGKNMKHILLSRLRNKNLTIAEYRNTAEKLGLILAAETATFLQKQSIQIDTPISSGTGIKLKNNIVLIPILRSGLILLASFLQFYENALVGFIGMKRDEKTAIPHLYYLNIPPIGEQDDIILLDPMIATGGSAAATLEILIKEGIKEEKIIFVAVIGSKEGCTHIKNKFPKIRLSVVEKDPTLTTNKFISPGLGDFGDRFFGTI